MESVDDPENVRRNTVISLSSQKRAQRQESLWNSAWYKNKLQYFTGWTSVSDSCWKISGGTESRSDQIGNGRITVKACSKIILKSMLFYRITQVPGRLWLLNGRKDLLVCDGNGGISWWDNQPYIVPKLKMPTQEYRPGDSCYLKVSLNNYSGSGQAQIPLAVIRESSVKKLKPESVLWVFGMAYADFFPISGLMLTSTPLSQRVEHSQSTSYPLNF